jgi:small subunit ribosomal protein S4
MTGPKEKRERTLGVRLGVKGERCQGPKCAFARRPNRPGVHGGSRRRKAMSDFGRQLQEKQKFKFTYGLDDRNLIRIFKSASKSKGDSATKMLELLERRLDNVLFRMGFAVSRGSGRQLVVQGHVHVNGVRLRSPGYEVEEKDVITLRPESSNKTIFKDTKEKLAAKDVPDWLVVDPAKKQGMVLGSPKVFDIPFEVNLLVESLSK